MTDSSWVTADASLLIRLAVPEEHSSAALDLWNNWLDGGIRVAAPSLVRYEFVSAMRQKVRRGLATQQEALAGLELLLALPIHVQSAVDHHFAALEIAARFDLASAYDAHYLAVAEALDCEFWTADRRLFEAVSERFPLIRRLGA